MIKIGQIGIGHNHGEGKMLSVRKFPELFEVVGFAEDNEEWIKKRGNLKGYEGLKRYSVDELIEKCDALLIETDVWDLTEIAAKCIAAGKHIHMDKPASSTLEDYKKVLDMAKDKKLVVQLGYMYRYNPAIQKCFELIKNGELGEIASVNAEMSTHHSPEYRTWLKNFGGGIMYILGSHLVDLIVYMLGKPEKISSFLKQTGLDGVEVEDNNLAVLEYKKALARIFVSSVEVNGWERRQFYVSGSKGTVSIAPIENPTKMTFSNLEIAKNPYEALNENVAVEEVPMDCRYDSMMQDFYDYVTGKKENPFTYEHEYAVQEVIDKIVGGVKCRGKNID